MANIGVNLDGFKPILNLYEKPLTALNKVMAILSMEWVSLIAVSLGKGEFGYSAPMIDFMHKVSDKMINTYVELDPEMIHQVINLKPRMITLVSGFNKSGFLNPVPVRQYENELKEIISELSAHDVVVGICIDPFVEDLKKVHRSGFEYIELNALHFSGAVDFNDELNELHKLREIANMAANLGMGVNVRGDIGEDNIGELGKIESFEEIILGDRFFRHAVFKSFPDAIEDFYHFLNS